MVEVVSINSVDVMVFGLSIWLSFFNTMVEPLVLFQYFCYAQVYYFSNFHLWIVFARFLFNKLVQNSTGMFVSQTYNFNICQIT